MRPIRLGRWGSCGLAPLGTRPQCLLRRAPNDAQGIQLVAAPASATSIPSLDSISRPSRHYLHTSNQRPDAAVALDEANGSSSSIPSEEEDFEEQENGFHTLQQPDLQQLKRLRSPPPQLAHTSAKLAALHARLALPKSLPVTTLAQCLIHITANPDRSLNNEGLALIGYDLLDYYMVEHILTHYPRLPLAVLFAAKRAYIGRNSLTAVAQSWGVEAAAAPGGEVDPGLLQFVRAEPGADTETVDKSTRNQDRNRRGDKVDWRVGMSSRLVYDDRFGDLQAHPSTATPRESTLDRASALFVAALTGAIHLKCGAAASAQFFKSHISSRQLDFAKLFTFQHPMRDLSRLCAREGYTPPVARIDAESGRTSASPVFVVGVYSGPNRLGQGAGSSKEEARYRASVNALKGWYLYTPPEVLHGKLVLPSETEGRTGRERSREFKPIHIDFGEVVV